MPSTIRGKFIADSIFRSQMKSLTKVEMQNYMECHFQPKAIQRNIQLQKSVSLRKDESHGRRFERI